MPHVLAISGSLRAHSTNTELLRAASLAAPPGVAITLYAGLATLPHFNPDVDDDALPEPVVALRRAVAGADAVLISTPEYAHGVPGSLKNALDWLVGGPEMVEKRVALWHASTWSTFAPAQLAEILHTMSARVVEEASVTINLRGRSWQAIEIIGDDAHRDIIAVALCLLARSGERCDNSATPLPGNDRANG